MSFSRAYFYFAMVVCLGAIQGCATPANTAAMTVIEKPSKINEKLRQSIIIDSVAGGRETNPLWTSQVGTNGFRGALEGSLLSAGYLASNPSRAKYRLSANLLELNQPMVGLTLDVKSNVLYQLKDDSGGVRGIPVSAVGVAGFSDAALAFERLRIANERSIYENIKELLRQLSEQ